MFQTSIYPTKAQSKKLHHLGNANSKAWIEKKGDDASHLSYDSIVKQKDHTNQLKLAIKIISWPK